MNSPHPTRCRILLVTTLEGEYRRILRHVEQLSSSGFQMCWESSPERALESVETEQYNVYFVMHQPDESLNGLAFLKRARKRSCTAPLVLLTDQRSHLQRALRLGAAYCLYLDELSPQLIKQALIYAKEQGRTMVRLCQTSQALKDSEERYTLAVRGLSGGIWDWNLQTNQIFYSPRWCGILGYRENALRNSPDEWFERVHPDDLNRLMMDITAHMEGITPHFENEHRMRCHNDTYRWVLSRGVAVRDTAGKPYRIVGSQTDITKRKEIEDKLAHEALHDPLTGLPNRTLFTERLERSIAHKQRRNDHHFAVLFLDLDRFKKVNDSLGHLVGDQLLVGIAKRLQQTLRLNDTVARLGGDEFAILLDALQDPEDALLVAERLRDLFAEPFQIDEHEVYASTSIGVALSTLDATRPDDYLRGADTAMYQAKGQGRDTFELYEPSMHEKALAELQIEIDLRRAIDQDELLLHYQPIISLTTGQTEGFEVLVRWQHPSRGMIPPGEFIPVAEESQLIIDLDRWVLREACRQLSYWRQQLPHDQHIHFNVNLSSKQLDKPDLPDVICELLDKYELPPTSLQLELTEYAVITHNKDIVKLLKKLREIGLRILIDDFGTGYSSLSYLHCFPVDGLKIDRSFVARLDENGGGVDTVQAILTLGRNLQLSVTAEGIETAKQMECLRGLNCHSAQGYFIARPFDASAALAFLQQPPKNLITPSLTSLAHPTTPSQGSREMECCL